MSVKVDPEFTVAKILLSDVEQLCMMFNNGLITPEEYIRGIAGNGVTQWAEFCKVVEKKTAKPNLEFGGGLVPCEGC